MYLKIDEADLDVEFNQGSPTNAIVDSWVFVDGNSLGVFEMPIEVPVLDLDENGVSEIVIFAGVRNNGIKSDAIIYPFYERLNFEFDFEELAKKELDLTFEYDENTIFEVIEDCNEQ